jgi:ATP-dependent RNA helicase RhlE
LSFSTFDLHPRVAAGLSACGFSEATPIQRRSIPPGLAGRDVMGLAQTGTGKTAAFALPILQRLMRGPRGRLRALVVAPTRELAEQIHEAIGALGGQTGLRSVTLYGGVNIRPQVARLRAGAEIAVACPGRLLDHVGQRTIDLRAVEVLVLDEADRMFDMGFLPAIRKIVRLLPASRQTLLFSATMPDDVRRLTAEVLRDPVTVQVGHTAPATTVTHAIFPVEPQAKTPLLLGLLARIETGSILVFTRTKHRAKRLGEQLARAGHAATSIQGNLSQSRRQAALDGFRAGRFRVLVATDIAARGIDVSTISHVVNYDMPDTTDAYTHRIGRTGRATRTGDAFTLVTREDHGMIRDIERLLGEPLERRTVDGLDGRQTTIAPPPSPMRPRAPGSGRAFAPRRSSSRRRRFGT